MVGVTKTGSEPFFHRGKMVSDTFFAPGPPIRERRESKKVSDTIFRAAAKEAKCIR